MRSIVDSAYRPRPRLPLPRLARRLLRAALPAALLLAPAVAARAQHGASAAAAAPTDLERRFETALDDTSAVVRGPHFALRWSTRAGGDLTSIRIHDGAVWHELLGAGRLRHSVPGLRLVTRGADYQPPRAAQLSWLERGPDRAVLAVDSRPATAAGVVSPFHVRQTYTVYREGAVFVDLDLELPAGAPLVVLERASIGWPVATTGYDLQRWHWRGSAARGEFFLEPRERSFTATPCPNLGLALGQGREFTNQLQFVIEDSRPLGATGPGVTALVNGTYLIQHLRPRQSGAVVLTPPYRYQNRWGLLLGRRPHRSPLIGQRLVFWEEGGESAMAFPGPGPLEAMVDCGASGVVLGPGWRRAGGRGGLVPLDARAMRAMIEGAHARGLRVVVTVTPSGDPDSLASWARTSGLDGLYLDGISPLLRQLPGEAAEYPARATFEWGRRLARALGPQALLLGRCGVAGPDLTMALAVPGVVWGLEPGDARAGREPLLGFYLGGQGYGVPCPLARKDRLRTTRALAMHAAAGAVPLVPLGYGPERSAYRGARWVLPLWQLHRTLPTGRAVELLGGVNQGVVTTSNHDFTPLLYRVTPTTLLLLDANLSPAPADSTALELDFDALGLGGAFAVEEVRGLEPGAFETIFLGRSTDGKIATGPVGRWGLRGYLFIQGDYPPAVGAALDAVTHLGRAFRDRVPPTAPSAPLVRAGDAALELSWQPARDRHHVEAYRVYRSPSAEFVPAQVEDLGLVYETTRFRDLDPEPGRRFHYAVSAIDQNQNEGPPSPAAAGVLPDARYTLTFDDPQAEAGLDILSGRWGVRDAALERGYQADATRHARVLLRDLELGDLDLRLRIDSPGGYRFAGGVLFRADDAGNGMVLLLGDPQASWLVLGRLEAGRLERIAQARYPYVTRGGARRTLRVLARGRRIQGSVDGRLLIDIEDGGPRPGSGTRIGLIAEQGHVRYDNLLIDPAAAPSP